MNNRLPLFSPSENSHLTPAVWSKVNRLLVRKAISEFAHESLFHPELLSKVGAWGSYQLLCDNEEFAYQFSAQRLSLNHWHIDAESIQKFQHHQEIPLDALSFIIEFRDTLGIKKDIIAVYLDEISSTLYGSAFKHHRTGLFAKDLIDSDFQSIETAMSEGHPCFVANNGRIGFNAQDYRHYAPESAQVFNIVWLAVSKQRAQLSLSSDLNYEHLLAEELGATQFARFCQLISESGQDPNDYWLMPAHPWQWKNKLSIAFAAEIANQHIIYLGLSQDQYLAQQSIRTFFNVSHPHKRYVKTALSILNMGFMRGLSPYYMSATPAINDWVANLVHEDAYLQQKGFRILREVAAIGYRNPYYEAAIADNNAYKKMFSALWRDSPIAELRVDEKLMTMTALLHLDNQGNALLAELIRASGVGAAAWIEGYLDAYFAPLLHCFYQHDMIFMPHGENLIMIMHQYRPVRVLMKDIAEEVGILNPEVQLPEIMQRVSTKIPDEMKTLCLFIDVFDGYFRHLAAILHTQCDFPETLFWQAVARCTHRYQTEHPELLTQFQRYDMFAASFSHSCLNRLQIANNQHMLNLEDPASGLQFAGRLMNPIAMWKDATSIEGA